MAGPADPEQFVREKLTRLEERFRQAALLALAEWDVLRIPAPEMFGAVASLQRPSWGTWNGLLDTLRRARRTVLREGSGEDRGRIEGAAGLNALFLALDRPAQLDLTALAGLAAMQLPRKPKLGDLARLPIGLRNRIAHDLPTDPAWWEAAAAALEPLPDDLPPSSGGLAEPWFKEGAAFNGLTKSFEAIYVNGARSQALGAEVIRAFQRMLGKANLQAEGFRELLAKLVPEELKGVLMGDFLVGREVGRGGFATVHLGRQLSMGRKVAIKVLRDGLDEDSRVRFRREAAFLSRLSHPHIVRVIAYGEDVWRAPRNISLGDEGWYQDFKKTARIKTFIALEWIEGDTLDVQFGKTRAGLTQWFVDAASALGAVHASGLIHRDVKPGNLMVTAEGVIKLMDFGIARTTEQERTLITTAGHSLGTPAYMSPEQLRATVAVSEVGVATDIYSLCATFYELYMGRRLYRHDSDDAETVRTHKLSGHKPERPSGLPWEIETILMGGLECEVEDRYHSMAALERDLRHVRNDEPIEYRRPSLGRRMRLGYRRNRAVVHTAALFLLALFAGTIFYVLSLKREQARTLAAKDLAEAATRRAEAAAEETKRGLLALYEKQGRHELLGGRPTRALAYLSEAYEEGRNTPSLRFLLARAWSYLPAPHPSLEAHDDEVGSAAFSPDGTRVVTASLDETAKIWDAASGRLLLSLEGHGGPVSFAAFSPDGTRVVTASWDGTARICDAASGKLLASLDGHRSRVSSVAFSPDGTRVVTTSWDAKIWDAASGTLMVSLGGHGNWVHAAAFSPDGTRVVTASWDNTAKIWDAGSGNLLASLDGHGNWLNTAAFSPDGTRVVTASRDDTAKIWDAASGQLLASLERHDDDVAAAAFSPDGTRIVTASVDDTAKIWDSGSGKLLVSLQRHVGPVASAAFSPDGTRVVTASWDKTAKVWDASSGRFLASLEGHAGWLASAAFSPDGSHVVTASDDKTAKIWNVARVSLEGHDGDVGSAVFSPDGTRVVTRSGDSTAKIWDAASGELLASLAGHRGAVYSAAFSSPAGMRVVTASEDKTAKIWNAARGKLLASLEGHAGSVQSAAFSPDGTHVATASWDKTAKIWDAASGKLLLSLEGHGGPVLFADFSPDGTRVVTASKDKTARMWSAASGEILFSLEGHGSDVWSVAFSPDGTRVVTASLETAKIWNATNGKLLLSLGAARKEAHWPAAFSPDGTRVVTASRHRIAKVWDASSGDLLASLEGHDGSVYSVAFSRPDGTRVVTASEDGTARIWDASSGEVLALLEGHRGWVVSAAFSPDGVRVVTASKDRTARIWDVHLETRSPAEIAALARARIPFRVEEGRLLPVKRGADGSDPLASEATRLGALPEYTGLLPKTLVAGPDGKRVAYVARTGSGQVAVVDLKPGPAYDSIARNALTFSPDGKRFAYLGRKKGKWFVVVDGRAGPPYDLVEAPVFSRNGQRVGYCARNGNVMHVVVDGIPGQDHGIVTSLVFSPDGKRLAYQVEDGERRFVFVDGKAGPDMEELGIGSLSFSADGKRFAYSAVLNGRWVAVVDHNLGRPYDAIGQGMPVFSRDGARVAYIARTGRRWQVVVDEEPGPLHKAIKKIRRPLSPDGRRVAYIARTGRGAVAVVDGQAGPVFDGMLENPQFSPDSRRVAYAAKKDRVWSLVVDGKASPVPGVLLVGRILFSPNSERLAHVDLDEQALRYRMVVDGRVGPGHRKLHDVLFSADSAHLAYRAEGRSLMFVVVDGRPGPEYEVVVPGSLVFRGNEAVEYLVLKAGVLFRVKHTLKRR